MLILAIDNWELVNSRRAKKPEIDAGHSLLATGDSVCSKGQETYLRARNFDRLKTSHEN